MEIELLSILKLCFHIDIKFLKRPACMGLTLKVIVYIRLSLSIYLLMLFQRLLCNVFVIVPNFQSSGKNRALLRPNSSNS